MSLGKDELRLTLYQMDDRSLLNTCGSSKYFRDEVCNEQFWRNRFADRFPRTKSKTRGKTWRETYLLAVSGYGTSISEGGINIDITIDSNGSLFQELIRRIKAVIPLMEIDYNDPSLVQLLTLYLAYKVLQNPTNIFHSNTGDDVFSLIEMYYSPGSSKDPVKIYSEASRMKEGTW